MMNLNLYKLISNIIGRRISSLSTLHGNFNLNYSTVILTNNIQNKTIFNTNTNLQKQILTSNNILIRNIFLTKINYKKAKLKEKKQVKVADIDFRELNTLYDMEKLKKEFEKSIENMKEEFINNFSLRTAAGSIELFKVKVEDKLYELQELAQVIRKPKVVILNVNFPTAIPSIINTINESGLNINPQQDGTSIFLPIPIVTKEYREKLVKGSKAVYIKYRDEIKNSRSKALKTLKNAKASPDVIRRLSSVIEKFTEQYLYTVEELLQNKQKELLGDSK